MARAGNRIETQPLPSYPWGRSWRLGFILWRDPTLHYDAVPAEQAESDTFKHSAALKLSFGLLRRDKNGDYCVAGELCFLNGEPPDYEQRTLIKRELVIRTAYVEKRPRE